MIPTAPIAAMGAISTDQSFSDLWMRNLWMKWLESTKEEVRNNAPVYLTDEQMNDKTFMDWLKDPAQSVDDTVQGLAFLASMLVPTNWIGSAVSKGSKLARWIEESQLVKSGLKGFDKLDDLAKEKLIAQGIDPIKFEAKLANTQKILEKTGVLTGAIVGRLGESAMEANQSYEEIIKELTSKGYSQDKAEEIAREQSNNVFGLNMALSIPDTFLYMSASKIS